MNLPFLSDQWFDFIFKLATETGVVMFEFVGSLFVLGSLMFYGLSVIGFIVLWWALESDEGWPAAWCVAIYLFLINFCGDAGVGSYVLTNPLTIIKWAFAYIVVGIIWSFIKFYSKIKFAQMNDKDIPSFDSLKRSVPLWMSYWPASMASTLLTDIVKNTFKYIANQFGGAYKKMYDHMVGTKS